MLAVQITTRDMFVSPALEDHLHKKAEKLNRYFDRITQCHVVIEVVQKHQHQGKLFNVRIDLLVPGKELVANHKCNTDVYVAIRDAFNAIQRQLESYARKLHGRVKKHEEYMHGTIIKLFSEEGYGFIQGMNGDEYYFGMTNIAHPTFDQLIIGDTVRFIAETSNEGCQARRIKKDRVHAVI
ncbi:MAG: ribosomal subunit interface protein [Gammaproteobacteria bacterium RIFCSPHIGHO2_12_FULL_41_20]|nr:MAG: ribosomal subunit interface protein [Gammaproteobacteria bacterium RIFCSPHIGHO2_12_FULL_41_20]